MKDQGQAYADETATVGQRGVVIAYLSYAMDEVKALSPTALYLLAMSIEALHHEDGSTNTEALPDPRH
jgi:hypothetical protein